MDFVKKLREEFGFTDTHTSNIIDLIRQGNTIPFIARYRKELTGNVDDQELRKFADRLEYYDNLEARKEEVIRLISEQEKLTDELENEIMAAETLTAVEDIYRPFRPKRKTRASVAKERGLEPLAEIMSELDNTDIEAAAEDYICEDVPDIEAALSGAMDIIAEDISDNAQYRTKIRSMTYRSSLMTSKLIAEDAGVYEMYADFSEGITKLANHRILALNRAEKEGVLSVSVKTDPDLMTDYLISQRVTNPNSPSAKYVSEACKDSYTRLIAPSIEREIRAQLTERAEEAAIDVFSKNLKGVLIQPPVKGHVCLGVDPAYRTGCKLAVVDKTSKVLDTAVIYPTPPQSKTEESKRKIKELYDKHGFSIIAIGNGTASKETEIFISDCITELGLNAKYAMVNEAGASVYSASKLAAEEFPQFDLTLRSAVSIARRLQDPLTELVKIDPKSIGVGQYQHDMNQKRLGQSLAGVVEDCVNTVGVDLNTASPTLLSYVSGINSAVAKNIAVYRDENGSFTTRSELKKVPKLGAKAFEQCAGFLRIPGGKNILDNTGVHPESYKAAKELLKLTGFSEDDLKNHRLSSLKTRVSGLGEAKVAESLGIGVPTLEDITEELMSPGRDIRESLPPTELRADIMDINDLKEGMIVSGTVRNVIDFGAFVDIGVHQDGLVHISQICDSYIKHPLEKLSVGDKVKVRILSVDTQKNRISLSMKNCE